MGMDDPEPRAPAPLPPRLLLFDGDCVLCHRWVKFLLSADRLRRLHFTTLTGETSQTVRQRFDDAFPAALDTVVYVEDGRLYTRTSAILRACRHLPWPARALTVLRLIPRPLADLGYRAVARTRYRLFGRRDTCFVPPTEARAQVLP